MTEPKTAEEWASHLMVKDTVKRSYLEDCFHRAQEQAYKQAIKDAVRTLEMLSGDCANAVRVLLEKKW